MYDDKITRWRVLFPWYNTIILLYTTITDPSLYASPVKGSKSRPTHPACCTRENFIALHLHPQKDNPSIGPSMTMTMTGRTRSIEADRLIDSLTLLHSHSDSDIPLQPHFQAFFFLVISIHRPRSRHSTFDIHIFFTAQSTRHMQRTSILASFLYGVYLLYMHVQAQQSRRAAR